MNTDREIIEAVCLHLLDLPQTKKGKAHASTYQDEGAFYLHAFSNIPESAQKRTLKELLDELQARGIAFEPRPFGGIYACRMGTAELRLDPYCTLSIDQYCLGPAGSKDIQALSDFISGADSLKTESKAMMQELKGKAEACTGMIHDFRGGIKALLNLRKKDKDWGSRLEDLTRKLESDLNALECIDPDTTNMIISVSRDSLIDALDKEYSEYVIRKQNQARKKGFDGFEKKLAEALDGYEYTVSRYKPMYGTESFRLNVKLPHGTVEYKSSLYVYSEKLPDILKAYVPVAAELSEALGKKITEKSMASFQDKDLLERYARVLKPAAKCGITLK